MRTQEEDEMHPYQSDVLARGRIARLHQEATIYRLAAAATGRTAEKSSDRVVRWATRHMRGAVPEARCTES
jgi:hypothetical protein